MTRRRPARARAAALLGLCVLWGWLGIAENELIAFETNSIREISSTEGKLICEETQARQN